MTLTLRDLVDKYLKAAGGYGKPVALGSLGLSPGEMQGIFSAFDDDYHISRFFHLSNESGEKFQINGFPQTHVSIDSEIQTIL